MQLSDLTLKRTNSADPQATEIRAFGGPLDGTRFLACDHVPANLTVIAKDSETEPIYAEGKIFPIEPLTDGASFHDYELFLRNRPKAKGLLGRKTVIEQRGGLYVFKGTRSYVSVK